MTGQKANLLCLCVSICVHMSAVCVCMCVCVCVCVCWQSFLQFKFLEVHLASFPWLKLILLPALAPILPSSGPQEGRRLSCQNTNAALPQVSVQILHCALLEYLQLY